MIPVTDMTTPNWSCVHFAQEFDDRATIDLLAASGFAVFRGSLQDVDDEPLLLWRIAVAMQFPDYFGGNWDALDECLCDMEWRPAKGYLLILDGSASIWRKAPQAAGRFIELWLAAAQQWARTNTAFHLLFVL